MFTVAWLGIDSRLARTLVTSNPIDSMISIARTTNRNVTSWKDGEMVLRWTAAGMINAERSFRRVKGYKQMPQLVAALYRHAHPETAAAGETVGCRGITSTGIVTEVPRESGHRPVRSCRTSDDCPPRIELARSLRPLAQPLP